LPLPLILGFYHLPLPLPLHVLDTLLVFKAAFQSAAGLKAQGGFKLPSGEIWSKGSKTMGQLRVKPNQSLTALSCRKVT
jgi:hypothetical protein